MPTTLKLYVRISIDIFAHVSSGSIENCTILSSKFHSDLFRSETFLVKILGGTEREKRKKTNYISSIFWPKHWLFIYAKKNVMQIFSGIFPLSQIPETKPNGMAGRGEQQKTRKKMTHIHEKKE